MPGRCGPEWRREETHGRAKPENRRRPGVCCKAQAGPLGALVGLAACAGLACVPCAGARPGEAVEPLSEALRIQRAALGPDHPKVARSTDSLGRTMLRLKRVDDAARLLTESLEIHRRILPDAKELLAMHPTTLAGVDRNRGMLESSERLADEGVELMRSAVTARSPSIATALRERRLTPSRVATPPAPTSLLASRLTSRRASSRSTRRTSRWWRSGTTGPRRCVPWAAPPRPTNSSRRSPTPRRSSRSFRLRAGRARNAGGGCGWSRGRPKNKTAPA